MKVFYDVWGFRVLQQLQAYMIPGKHGYLSLFCSLSLSLSLSLVCLFVCFGRWFCGLVEKLCHPSQKGL